MPRIEARLRKVEQSVRDYEQDRWKRSNPEARARASDLVAQLEKTIAGLESDLANAQTAGNARRIKDTEQSLAARREWLEQAQRALEEFTG
jgi:capsule polysaccharide export protein KpsE/RkpR